MGSKSAIEWTQATWNPVTECTKVSPGCKHCYAERIATRLQAMGQPRYANGFRVTLHLDLVDLPRRWWAPRLIFVNSMSDLFHEAIPEEFIRRVFDTMVACPHHTFHAPTNCDKLSDSVYPNLSYEPIYPQTETDDQDRWLTPDEAVKFGLTPGSRMYRQATGEIQAGE